MLSGLQLPLLRIGAVFSGAILSIGCAVFFIGVFVGCAMPVSHRTDQDAVPERDLLGVSLTREGLSLYHRTRFAEAELKFRQALYLFPTATNLKENLAASLEGSGQIDEAVAIYQELLSSQPDSIRYRIALGRSEAARGNYREAQAHWDESLKRSIDRGETARAADVARTYASYYFRRGNEEQARCYSALALQFRPSAEELAAHTRILNSGGFHRKVVALTMGAADPAVLLERGLALIGSGELLEGKAVVRQLSEAADGPVEVLAEARSLEAILIRAEPPAPPGDVATKESKSEEEEVPAVLPTLTARSLLIWPPRLVEFYLEEKAKEESV